jgi:DNA-binding HxlR family transcriptional regulator
MGEPAQSIAIDGAGREPVCPYFHEAVELIGKRWTGAIVHVLLPGPMRFCEISQSIPEISDRLLSMRLRELEAEQIVAREVLDGAPVRVEYELTPKGRALRPAIEALEDWGREWVEGAPVVGALHGSP